MLAIALALLLAAVLGLGWEGVVRVPGVLGHSTFYRRGRVAVVMYAHRPGRVYVRVGVV